MTRRKRDSVEEVHYAGKVRFNYNHRLLNSTEYSVMNNAVLLQIITVNMNRIILVTALMFLLSVTTNAQKGKKNNAVYNSIVRDADSVIIPYNVWVKLVCTFKYDTKPINPDDDSTEFLLYPIPQEQLHKDSLIKPPESKYFTTGKPIINFSDKDINGNRYNLKKLRGKIIVLHFGHFQNNIFPNELSDLNDLVDSFKNNKEVIFISICKYMKWDVEDFLKVTPFKYNVIANAQNIIKNYGIYSYPINVIIDKEGKVYFHTSGLGLSTVYWMKKAIQELIEKG